MGIEIVGYYGIHRAATIRGYDTSVIGAARDLLLYLPIIVMAIWVSAAKKFKGNWVLFTSAILLFSIGMLIQYRLYSDPEYNARNKSAAREEKTDTLRMRYINQNYDATKRQMMGLPPTPPPADQEAPVRESDYTSRQRDHFELHVDSHLFTRCLCAGFLVLRKRSIPRHGSSGTVSSWFC